MAEDGEVPINLELSQPQQQKDRSQAEATTLGYAFVDNKLS